MRRPIGVWLVSAFYLLSAGWTLLSFALIFGGAIKITAAQEAYFASLSGVDWFFSLAIGVVGFSAAVCLFLLRRVALALFPIALALNLAFTAVHVMRTNWAEALGGAGLVGALFGWLILVAVIVYTRRLAKRGGALLRWPNNVMQRTALRTAADAGRYTAEDARARL
ncbi:MAG: hypothetical protein O3B03_07110 [Proteobacteria bacterium]|nr:hypothetical protein [Pseudomonadota bacterium]